MKKFILLAGLSSSLAIFMLGKIGQMTGLPILIAPFGASCVLIFGFPDNPFVRPKNLIFGHLICAGIGLLFLFLNFDSLAAISMAVGLSISLMLISDTIHPAAGANPILIIMTHAKWSFLVCPILIGVSVLIGFSFIYRRLIKTV